MSAAHGAAWAAQSLAVSRPPAVIAHRGGNSATHAREAIGSGADLLEVDLWSHRRRLEARHERRISRSPVLYERWYLRWSPGMHFALPDLLRMAEGRAGILLDFKNRRNAPELVREATAAGRGGALVCASSQLWHVLRVVHAANPHIELFYSIDVRSQLDLFRSVAQRDDRPTGVSCNHRHLDQTLVDEFHERGLAIIAWTVNDLDRAAELADWGVDAITTDRVADVRKRLGER